MTEPIKSSSSRKKIVLILVTLLLGGLVSHVVNERSAEQDWDAYKAAAAARGEPIEWRHHIPNEPPASENFYGASIVQKWMPKKGGDSGVGSPLIKSVKASDGAPVSVTESKPSAESKARPPRFPSGSKIMTPPSMKELKALPAIGKDGETLESLHNWFEQWNSEFEEFRAAGKRRHVYLPGDYTSAPTVPIQNFVYARTLAQAISAKAKINLLLGAPEMARKDLESIECVMRGMETLPTTLVASMIRTAVAGLYVDVVQEGLSANLWKQEQIKSIQDYLGAFDVMTPVQKSMINGERVAIAQVLDAATGVQGGIDAAKMFGSGERSRVRELIGALYPRSWIRRNQIYICGILDDTAAAIDAKNKRFHPERGQQVVDRVTEETKGFHPTRMLASVVIPNFSKAFETAARNQSHVDMAAVACGLERYKSEKGTYPTQLAELIPTYLSNVPRDVVTAKPVIYKKTDAAKFMLYAAGTDGKDNDGDRKTDWVWAGSSE